MKVSVNNIRGYIFMTIQWLEVKYKLSNRRAIGEHTSIAVNCIPPAEVALNLAFGDFERNGYVYGHRVRDEGVEWGKRERVTYLNTIV